MEYDAALARYFRLRMTDKNNAQVTLFRVGALLLNLAVVGYLAYRKRLFVGI